MQAVPNSQVLQVKVEVGSEHSFGFGAQVRKEKRVELQEQKRKEKAAKEENQKEKEARSYSTLMQARRGPHVTGSCALCIATTVGFDSLLFDLACPLQDLIPGSARCSRQPLGLTQSLCHDRQTA